MSDTAQKIWITGASSGIGEAVAIVLARRGYTVFASARSEDKLQKLAKKSESLSGQIIAAPCDVTKPEKIKKTLDDIEKEHGELDAALLNAGTFFADEEGSFTAKTFKKTFDINVYGAAYCLEPLIQRFEDRSRGHIAIVASVAGFRGLPRSLAYGPSKAALINLAESLYLEYKPKGIKVQLINPGFIKTPLTDKNDFKMPMLMPVEDAAVVIANGLESDRFEITMPWQFVYLKKMIDLLPNKLYFGLINKMMKR